MVETKAGVHLDKTTHKDRMLAVYICCGILSLLVVLCVIFNCIQEPYKPEKKLRVRFSYRKEESESMIDSESKMTSYPSEPVKTPVIE